MIKILFFIDTTLSSGGAEKVLCELVNSMDASRFQITVHTLWKEDAHKHLFPHIRYRYIFPVRNKFNHFLFRLQTALGLTYQLHLKDDYDIEVAYLENGPTKILAHSTNNKARKIAWVHCDLEKMTADINRYVKKTASWYSRYDKIVCVSDYILRQFRKLYGLEENTLVLHNTLDEKTIIEKALLSMPDSILKRKTTVITVGRLYQVKGYHRLLEAHSALIREGIDHDLWILGEGPERASLEAYISRNQLDDSVHLLGFQNNPYPFMREADIVVCSSYYEGYSTMVTEALILGKPVVTTPCSGMDELLGRSEFGLITENSTVGICSGLRSLLINEDLRVYYAHKSAYRGKSFSKKTILAQTESFFTALLTIE